MTRATRARFVVAGALALACPVLDWAFSRWGEALFPAYRTFSKAFAAAQAGVAGVVPFALWDLVAAALVVVAIVSLVRRIRRRRSLSPWLSWVWLVCAAAAFLFVGWALNHYAPSLASEMGLEVGEYSTDELADATEAYLEEAAALAPQVPRESGTSSEGEKASSGTDGRNVPVASLPCGKNSVATLPAGKNSVAIIPTCGKNSVALIPTCGKNSVATLPAAATLPVAASDSTSLAEQDFFELARIAGASYQGLSGTYPVFEGSMAPVKALLLWGYPLLFSGHTGIYWAPTGESGVPLDCARAELPFTLCHEAAHRLGIASEQEANFAAFLACQASSDVRLRYSGYYEAFAYCYNALYQADPDCAQQVLQEVASQNGEGSLVSDSGESRNKGVSPDSDTDRSAQGTDQNGGGSPDAIGVALVLKDRADTSEHYRQFEGPFEDVGTTVNDTYLKSFGETSGVRSYGEVVDYLIAWHERGGV